MSIVLCNVLTVVVSITFCILVSLVISCILVSLVISRPLAN